MSALPPHQRARGAPHRDTRTIATLAGWLMVVTFLTSIPAYFILYAPVRENPDSITAAGADPTASVALGAVLELVLIIANLGTAVVPYARMAQRREWRSQ